MRAMRGYTAQTHQQGADYSMANEGDPRPHHNRLHCYDDLEGSLQHAWSILTRGAVDAKSNFHIATLATVTQDGRPRARSVVLRACNAAERWLGFNTDRRSDKFTECSESPHAVMHFYAPKAKIQLRVRVRLEVLDGPALNTNWANTRPFSRVCYQVTQAPGSPIDAPLDVDFDAEASNDGADHFASVRAHVTEIEWLYLHARGHRRALYRFGPDGDEATWLVP